MSGEDKVEDLRQKRKEARQTGGPESIAARHRTGAMSARERVERLVDEDTFVELDVFIKGAVTGHGMIGGRDVYIFSQDGEASTYGAGVSLSRKLNKVADLALANGAPLVGIYDSGKMEASPSLEGLTELPLRSVEASGVVPQVAAIVGPVCGSATYAPALADLVVMVKGSSQLFLGDPKEAKGSGVESAAGARALSEKAGVAHLACDDESACLEAVRKLLSYLPQNNLEEAPLSDVVDPVDRMDAELDALAGQKLDRDVRQIVGRVLDENSFVELLPVWGKRIVTGFARLGGRSVGVVANQTVEAEGLLDADSACKAARFVRLCDCFNLPLITLVDTPGSAVGEADEQGRLLREAAKLMYAYAEASVPKLTVVIGNAYGEGFAVMCPKNLKADLCFGWPTASISARVPVDGADEGVQTPYQAAQDGHLDDVIEPATTRPRLVAALEACASKRESRPSKKHGNIPL